MTALRLRLLAAMGLGLTACIGDKTPADSGDVDSAAPNTDSGEVDRTCEDVDVLTTDQALQLGWDTGGTETTWLVCGEKTGDTCPDMADVQAHELLREALGEHPEPEFCGWYGTLVCGPEAAIEDACCYEMTVGQICEGRPLTIEGTTRRAEVRGGDAWSARVVAEPDAAKAARWLTTARDEHASVAAFARWTLQLMQLGAPPELLLETQRAAADEVRHAQLAFGLASAFAGTPLTAGPLPTAGALDVELTAIVRAHLLDACVNETVAAILAADELGRATGPEARVLRVIAADEARHAELAWKTLAWLLTLDDGLAGIVRSELADLALDDAVAQRALDEVVRPCAEALLG